MKKCTLCKEEKKLSSFYKKGLYYQSRCKICQKELCKKRTLKNRINTEPLKTKKGEVFKEIITSYLVSNFGNIYREEHYFNDKFYRGKYLSTPVLKIGYKKVTIRGKQYLIHRLIADNFIPNPLNKKQVNHKDSNRCNNSIDNLEWVTQQENITHAAKKGRMAVKLDLKKVEEIRLSKDKPKEIALKYGVSVTNIRLILNNKIWKK
jgi:hypothetical protein